ncbi:major capsid protein, partial [Enterobacter hormaechei subsp. steigerwaltii]
MAVKGVNALTLADWAKRTDPNGKVDKIVELLSQTNEILTDMMFVEGNLPTGHRTTVRSGLPQPTWRLLNYGVQPTKSTTVQVTDTVGMLEAYAEVDKSLADLNGN